MKKRLASGYTFDASAKTIVHADFSDITLEGIQLIVNVTDQIIIYNFADTTKGGTLSTDTLTLEYDTTSMSDTDKLMILVEDGSTTQVVSATDLDIRNLTNTDVVTAELSAVDNAVLDTIAAKDFATQTTLAAMNAKMVTGTDIGDVTINNASGASAVNIQDGGNTITVDGTVTAAQATAANLNMTEASAAAIKTAVETIDNAISGSEMQVDVVAALPAGTNAIGKLAANSGVDIGDVDVTSIAAGTNSIGNVGVIPRTSGGLLIKNCTSGDGSTALTNSAQAIKASAGQLFGWYIFNPNTVTAWVIIYNTAAASVTVGTTSPVMVLGIPAGAAANVVNPMGIEFTNAGWSAAAVMTSAAGNTAPTTALDANFFYI